MSVLIIVVLVLMIPISQNITVGFCRRRARKLPVSRNLRLAVRGRDPGLLDGANGLTYGRYVPPVTRH